MNQHLAGAAFLLFTACGSRSGLRITRYVRDAGPLDSGVQAPRNDGGIDAGDLECPPGTPCDCLTGGQVIWNGVNVCASNYDGLALAACGGHEPPGWGDRIRLHTRCHGDYTVTARVIAHGSGCEVATSIGTQTLSSTYYGYLRMPGWVARDACAADAFQNSGGHVCVSVSWSTPFGHTGSSDLGCFEDFGPYCVDCPPGGGGGAGDGSDGSWDF